MMIYIKWSVMAPTEFVSNNEVYQFPLKGGSFVERDNQTV
jgi:hypothetical protein